MSTSFGNTCTRDAAVYYVNSGQDMEIYRILEIISHCADGMAHLSLAHCDALIRSWDPPTGLRLSGTVCIGFELRTAVPRYPTGLSDVGHWNSRCWPLHDDVGLISKSMYTLLRSITSLNIYGVANMLASSASNKSMTTQLLNCLSAFHCITWS